MSDVVGIYGLGYVGLTLAIFLAKKGINVLGFELDSQKVEKLREGDTDIKEPFIKDLLIELQKDGMLSIFETGDDVSESLKGKVVFVTLGTPVRGTPKTVDSEPINKLCEHLSEISVGIIALRSTVPVGFSDKIKKNYPEIGIVFAPERTVEGKAIEELESLPQIVASEDRESREKVADIFRRCGVMALESNSTKEGELSKLACNTYRDYYFAYFNALVEISKGLGLSAENVIKLSSTGYKRFPKGIPGPVSGPCLTKDSFILKSSFQAKNSGAELIWSARKLNASVDYSFVDDVTTMRLDKVLILGTSFKSYPETSDTRDSHTLKVAKELIDMEMNVSVFDPFIDSVPNWMKGHYKHKVELESFDVIYVGAQPDWVREYLENRQSKLQSTYIYWAYQSDALDSVGRKLCYGC